MRKTALKPITKTSAIKENSALKNGKQYIVGIGSSAGGLEALKAFFDVMPPDSGMTFVVVQHMDPTHKSLLSELLSEHSKMKVAEITDGIKIKPNSVYVLPPNKDLVIKNGFLKLQRPKEARAIRKAIDHFFSSLAKDQKNNAVGIILSGTGTDGTIGLQEIKAKGGITLVQDPKSSQFSGMPKSAISAKLADFILTPEKMPEQLINYFEKKNKVVDSTIPDLLIPDENQLKRIFQLVRSRTGNDFSNYKTNMIIRRISKRASLNHISNIEDYLKILQNDPNEIEKLYSDFLIGVTSFFRDKEVFKSIQTKVIPQLLEKCIEKQELRIWVCGCSTGEEAYSLAILIKEALEKNKCFIKIMLFATDIDKEAIDFARIGRYSENSLKNVSDARRSHYFIRKENGYQLTKEIREMLVFAQHNVIKDPPFSKIDFISCRNLLIYMDNDLQKRIIPTFYYSLNTDGILLLGSSESIGDSAPLFSVVDSKAKIFKKKNNNIARKSNAPFELPSLQFNPTVPKAHVVTSAKRKINVSGLTEKILLDNYAPPSVIIDKNNQVLYFSGNTALYLSTPSGEASLNILDLAKSSLKPNLVSAIKKARTIKSEVKIQRIDVKVNQHYEVINLVVKPVLTREVDLGALMIIFENAENGKKNRTNKKTGANKNQALKITEIEKELKITREHLQTAINELETSSEDLQTTNEEFQSSNEELQSTNEELETSREELQSVNEELTTVNTELTSKIDQLSEVNDDLNNLLASIEVATVFLDRDLKIKRFTPTATKIFNLIPSDINRPVTHLSTNIVYKALVDDVKNALKTLSIKSADVLGIDGSWYHMRILPYRTTENVIEGVLVTFIDITEQKNVEEKLKKTNEHLNLIMESLATVPFTCVADPEIKISFVGKSSEKVTGFLPEQFTSRPSFWYSRVHPDDKKKIRQAFKDVVKKGSLDLPFRWKCVDGKYKSFTNFIRYAKAAEGRTAYIVGVWQESKSNIKPLKETK